MPDKMFIGRVLPDGHLSLPENTGKEVGKAYKVTLVPLDDDGLSADELIGNLARINGLGHLTDEDIAKIIQEVRSRNR